MLDMLLKTLTYDHIFLENLNDYRRLCACTFVHGNAKLTDPRARTFETKRLNGADIVIWE